MLKILLIGILIMFTLPLIPGKIITVDMKDIALGRGFPRAAEIEENFYVLDKQQRKVFVFDEKKYLFSFAQAGQGPGDLENPEAIASDGEKIYIMDVYSGKISIFSKEGRFLNTFKLKEDSYKILSLLCDIGIYHNKIVVVLTRGKDFVRFYDLDGNLLNTVSKKKENFKRLGHSYDLDIDEKKNKAYILSRFSGETLIVCLDKQKVLNKLEIRGPVIDKLLKPIIKQDKLYKAREDLIDLSEYVGFFPLIRDNDKLTIICSSDKARKNDKYLSYTFTGSISPTASYIDFGVKDIWYIKKFCRYYLLIDKEGDIFLKRRLQLK